MERSLFVVANVDKTCHSLESYVMATTTMNISLPDSLRVFVEDTLTDNGYGSASEYVRELIRADQKRRHEDRLETLLLERLQSGDDETFTIDDVRLEMRRRINAKK